MSKPLVVIGLLGTTLDVGKGPNRWDRWRPSVCVCQQEDMVVSRFELLTPPRATGLRDQIIADIASVSPETVVGQHTLDLKDPWDFEGVYAGLHDFARSYPFVPDKEEYLVHITTGTHVAQICLFLLTESRHFPAKLIQSGPKFRPPDPAGEVRLIDLDLSRYDKIATRFDREHKERVAGLKSGISTRNAAFNRLINELEHVATHATDPILLMGPTGAGKSQLARRVYELKKQTHRIAGPFVEVNCATLRGDTAMSTLFGHRKGAFTGAASDRAGLLRSANGGQLFLDEIGELGLDEQAMLLRALEERRFLPVGADKEVESDFQLIGGTNCDLKRRVQDGQFREDLLARINLWTFTLPPLRERREDIEPNLDFELERFAARCNRLVRFSREARDRYLEFATSSRGVWRGNFRDLASSITRMATLSPSGRISVDIVDQETARLLASWIDERDEGADCDDDPLLSVLSQARIAELDRFDRVQLTDVVRVCMSSRSLSEAGRELFAASRASRTKVNDSDRLRKYLARFDLSWQSLHGA
ncbi:MAG: sigma 54-interacting transcriptional regulator [Pyrinomonadaceae bacterium]|nr:sigma 54-interacting transcriptional regulator [Phycisphaerales bacterium]